ncbi:MAG: Asp-tRNA(Asn)/Glu-tRNA(Gln) amidotransferase subunit GatB [Oscillospiraceae bacterium]|nr:Asp-tRNA(Asn)/Glu-tRNA(Gln) amidotransferase subunit GatB [Oscillospiraceae bacterium]
MDQIYEMVIGLEVHVELKTKTKIFCGCSTSFGAEQNTQCCPVCMGMPGTLPVLNRQVVRHAVKAGLATNCRITRYGKQDRKNYFYPDLPKAYQISQYDLPLCTGGYLDIEGENGAQRIGITRIHIEEDAGKLVHQENGTCIDYNRCGVPLVEIVSEPDIRSASQALAFLQKLRAILLYIGVSDCKMNEGSLRCDVNLSAHKPEEPFGIRTEMKNLNSFSSVRKAIEYEFKRQVEVLSAGGTIDQETRRFDADSGKTYTMRKKEDAHDYRYFPDPDLMPIVIREDLLRELQGEIPQLPDERKRIYMERYGLGAYDAEQLVTEKEIADYFEKAVSFGGEPKQIANLILSEVFRLLPPEDPKIPVSPEHLSKLCALTASGEINGSTGKKVLHELWRQDRDPEEIVREQGLQQISDESLLSRYVDQVMEENPKLVDQYRSGKEKVLQALIGQMMKKTRGQGNPRRISDLLLKSLRK